MKIFISWSGEQSKAIAAVFKDWIPAVVQAARPYFSPSDIDKGSRWANEISKELEASRMGLICLTKENLSAPWLMFEAGALSKSLESARVCPMLFGVDPSDLAGPLVQFQAASFSKDEVHKFITMLNQQLDGQALTPTVLDSVFEKWWPDLEEKVGAILSRASASKGKNLRTEREVLEEVLALTRTLAVRERSEQDGALDVSVPRIMKAVDALHEFGRNLVGSATAADQLKMFKPAVVAVMRVIVPSLSDSQRNRIDPKMIALLEAVDDKLKELDDDIPF